MALANNHDGDLRPDVTQVELKASGSDKRKLLFQNLLILTLGDSIAIDEDIGLQGSLVVFLPRLQTLCRHV